MSKHEVFLPSARPVLARLLTETGLTLVDIGGRGSAFPPLLSLAPFANYVVSEPDREEAERLQHQLPLDAPWRSVTVLREAIASRRGEAPLYLTAQPGMSSLLEPDPLVARRFYLHGKFDVVRTATVPTVPLDEAASAHGFADAAFLKVDTQGTELDILQSGAHLVGEALLGVNVESLFQPFYKGQSLFADVDAYLRDHGFTLFSLSRTTLRRAGYQATLYSKRVITWAHCLYLREPETILAVDRHVLLPRLTRLLGLALAFEHYDLSLEIVGIARRESLLPSADLDQLTDEVIGVAGAGTRRMLAKAERMGQQDLVMASNFRDRKQLE